MSEVVVLRDRVEAIVRAWHTYELDRGARPVIDYDCHPQTQPVAPVRSRLDVYQQLARCAGKAAEIGTAARDVRDAVRAHRAYLSALLGRREPLLTYLRDTQGCEAAGWPEQHILAVRERAVRAVTDLGLAWGPQLHRQLYRSEREVDPAEAAEQIPAFARTLEPVVRELVQTDAPYTARVEPVAVDDYWGQWLDGAGPDARLRINRRGGPLTDVLVRQFALHEVLGHALQSASFAHACAQDPDVPWIRLLSVHLPYQVALEGMAQAMPLFFAPDDAQLVARLRLTHYLQLVRAELHLAVNTGIPLSECANHARARVPWWTDALIGDLLGERGNDPLLRSYLWAYPAGVDWWVSLSTEDDDTRKRLLRAAYQRPLTPAHLEELIERPRRRTGSSTFG